MNALDFIHKNSLQEGELVEVQAATKIFTAYVMPSKDEILSLKAKSGYNFGLNVNTITGIKKLGEKKQVGKSVIKKIEQNNSLPKISILHTGGTIASRVDYVTGAVNARFNAEDLLSMFPELFELAQIETKLIANMMSEDMRFSNYQAIAKAVKEETAKGAKGIIVGHGTDTLHYTASALSFMLENCPIPVLLVGAQRSSDRGSTDAALNLLSAAYFITQTDFAGVAICMHENSSDDNCTIISGTHARKLHTSRRDAFKTVNDIPIASVNFKEKKIDYLKKDYSKKSTSELIIKEKLESKVGLLKAYPNMQKEQFEFFEKQGYKGFVLEGTGLGQAPTNTLENQPNYEALKSFISKGGIVVLTSQCIFGRVDPFVYSEARKLYDLGIIFSENMTTETAYIKLAWLLGNYPKDQVKKLFAENLRGEITERTEFDSFDLPKQN